MADGGWYLFAHICELIQSLEQAAHFDLIPREISKRIFILATINTAQTHQPNTVAVCVKRLSHAARTTSGSNKSKATGLLNSGKTLIKTLKLGAASLKR